MDLALPDSLTQCLSILATDLMMKDDPDEGASKINVIYMRLVTGWRMDEIICYFMFVTTPTPTTPHHTHGWGHKSEIFSFNKIVFDIHDFFLIFFVLIIIIGLN